MRVRHLWKGNEGSVMLTWRIRVTFSRERTLELVSKDEKSLSGITNRETHYSREAQRSENE